jgi:hypothetical protein
VARRGADTIVRAVRAIVALLLGLAVPPARADDLDDLRRQLDAQNALIRQQADMLERQRQMLERQSQEMEKLGDRLRQVEKQRGIATPKTPRSAAPKATVAAPPPAAPPGATVAAPPPEEPEVATTAQVGEVERKILRNLPRYEPGRGFSIASGELGQLDFSAYTYVRYLNQKALDRTFVNGLGDEVTLVRQDNVNLVKGMLYFKGWLLDPKFRYLLYVWTNNTSQGLSAQVVLGGNLQYAFNEAFVLGGGIFGLPTVRSTEGAWPFLLGVDHRTLADEFFRGSYSMGFFATGKPLHGVQYSVGIANNLSQLGVDAGQLANDFTTVSSALWWMPTTGEFGPRGEFGDYAWHEDVATRVGVHFTFSPEDKQSQPGTEDPDNTQIRLSNGTIIFTRGALAPGVAVRNVNYYMTSLDGGVKYRGLSLEGEYYLRWLTNIRASGPVPVGTLFDTGFQLQASAMLIRNILQAYTTGSYVNGEYGYPWEVTAGLNWFPFSRRELRVNLEYLHDFASPVGFFAIPQVVGGTGSIVNANVELRF